MYTSNTQIRVSSTRIHVSISSYLQCHLVPPRFVGLFVSICSWITSFSKQFDVYGYALWKKLARLNLFAYGYELMAWCLRSFYFIYVLKAGIETAKLFLNKGDTVRMRYCYFSCFSVTIIKICAFLFLLFHFWSQMVRLLTVPWKLLSNAYRKNPSKQQYIFLKFLKFHEFSNIHLS